MSRRRLTQLYPWLIPIRKKQRCFMFYWKMYFDKYKYAERKNPEEQFFPVFQASSLLINPNTGHDLIYQENKVHNLKLAAGTIDGLLIRPGETFSFWHLVRHAQKKGTYKDGLSLVYGSIVKQKGGGLCQLSNLLFWLFLHSPLDITERHAHRVTDFPPPEDGIPPGTDATVNEGWLDLKVHNSTEHTYQIRLEFDEHYITGILSADSEPVCVYEVEAQDIRYMWIGGKICQKADIYRKERSITSSTAFNAEKLYENKTLIGYDLPEGTVIRNENAAD